MMETKLFEIRDKGTFIPMVGILCKPVLGTESETYLLRRAGYAPDSGLVLLTRLDGGESHYDPYDWSGRTYPNAHAYIQENWANLRSGDVIDVEVVLGEATTPKLSERLTA